MPALASPDADETVPPTVSNPKPICGTNGVTTVPTADIPFFVVFFLHACLP